MSRRCPRAARDLVGVQWFSVVLELSGVSGIVLRSSMCSSPCPEGKAPCPDRGRLPFPTPACNPAGRKSIRLHLRLPAQDRRAGNPEELDKIWSPQNRVRRRCLRPADPGLAGGINDGHIHGARRHRAGDLDSPARRCTGSQRCCASSGSGISDSTRRSGSVSGSPKPGSNPRSARSAADNALAETSTACTKPS
jgi:hypothetical protein